MHVRRILGVQDPASLSPADRMEIDYYRRIREDKGEAGFFDLLLDKSDFIRVFRLRAGRRDVEPGMEVLEPGAGQGWASCLVERLQPAARVTAEDISRSALQLLRPGGRAVFLYESAAPGAR